MDNVAIFTRLKRLWRRLRGKSEVVPILKPLMDLRAAIITLRTDDKGDVLYTIYLPRNIKPQHGVITPQRWKRDGRNVLWQELEYNIAIAYVRYKQGRRNHER